MQQAIVEPHGGTGTRADAEPAVDAASIHVQPKSEASIRDRPIIDLARLQPDLDQDGKTDAEEQSVMVRERAPGILTPAALIRPAHRVWQDTFQRADKDGDGKLSAKELTTALRDFKDTEKQRRRLWKAVKAAIAIIVVQARLLMYYPL